MTKRRREVEVEGGAALAGVAELVPTPKTSNVVCTFTTKCALDLLRISQKYLYEFVPRRFAACTQRLTDPASTALIFTSGKVVVTGCRSALMGLLACRLYVSCLQRRGERLSFSQFRIQNIVASVDSKVPINLEQMRQENSSMCSYEPALFPGLIYRPGVCVFLIFRSGRCVITGAKSHEAVETQWTKTFRVICKYRDTSVNASKCSSEYRKKLKMDAPGTHADEMLMDDDLTSLKQAGLLSKDEMEIVSLNAEGL